MVRLGDLLHLRTRIGNRNKATACLFGADRLFHSLEEILFENIGLECASRLTGNNKQGVREVNLIFESFDLCGVGGVEHMELGESGNLPESHAKHFRCKAGASHTEQKNVAESFFLNFLS